MNRGRTRCRLHELAVMALVSSLLPVSAGVAQAGEQDLAVSDAEAGQLGEVGESCRARRDCRRGLHCLDGVCRSSHEGDSCVAAGDCSDGLACREQRCVSPFAHLQRQTTTASKSDWSLADGFHLGVGMNLGAGPVSWYRASWDSIDLETGLVASIHILATYKGFAGELEFAPATFIPSITAKEPPMVSTGHLALGYYLPLGERSYLVFRGGAGGALGVGQLAPYRYLLFSARIEPIGLVYTFGRVPLELTLPSVRMVTDLEDHTVVGWFVAMRASLLFL